MYSLTKNNSLNGIILGLISITFSSMSYPILKSVMTDLSPVQVALIDSLICSIIFFPFIIKNFFKNIFSKELLLIGFINGLGCLFFFSAIGALNPGLMGLMGRNQLVFSVIFSFVIFKEKIRIGQILISAIVMAGSFLFAYKGIDHFSFWGILMAFTYCFFFASGSALFKKNSLKVKTSHVVFTNKLMAFVIILIFSRFIAVKLPLNASVHDVCLIAISAIFTVGIGFFLYLNSLKHLTFFTANLIRAIGPVLVLLFSLPFYQINFSLLNIFGGAAAFAATIVLIVMEHRKTLMFESEADILKKP